MAIIIGKEIEQFFYNGSRIDSIIEDGNTSYEGEMLKVTFSAGEYCSITTTKKIYYVHYNSTITTGANRSLILTDSVSGVSYTIQVSVNSDTAQYDYTWDGWYTGGSKISSYTIRTDKTFTAQATRQIQNYVISFTDKLANIPTITLPYGSLIKLNVNTTTATVIVNEVDYAITVPYYAQGENNYAGYVITCYLVDDNYRKSAETNGNYPSVTVSYSVQGTATLSLTATSVARQFNVEVRSTSHVSLRSANDSSIDNRHFKYDDISYTTSASTAVVLNSEYFQVGGNTRIYIKVPTSVNYSVKKGAAGSETSIEPGTYYLGADVIPPQVSSSKTSYTYYVRFGWTNTEKSIGVSAASRDKGTYTNLSIDLGTVDLDQSKSIYIVGFFGSTSLYNVEGYLGEKCWEDQHDNGWAYYKSLSYNTSTGTYWLEYDVKLDAALSGNRVLRISKVYQGTNY